MEQIKKPRYYLVDYLLLLFIILWSGGGFTFGYWSHWCFFLLPILIILFFNRRCNINYKEILFIGVLTVWQMLQCANFGQPLINVIHPITNIICVCIITKILKGKFTFLFVRICVFFAFVSLVIWTISLIPAVYSKLYTIALKLPHLGFENIINVDGHTGIHTLYFFSYSDYGITFRNYGPFWEPGRFTIFLVIALCINTFKYKEKILSFRNLILILTNITTFSTTGYIAMFLYFILYIQYSNIRLRWKLILIVVLGFSIPVISNLDFMSDKVQNEMEDTYRTSSRFGAIVYHMEQIEESPILGFGSNLTVVYNELELSPNGWTALVRYWGIPISLVLLILLFKGTSAYLKNNSKLICFGVGGIILTLAFTQTIMLSPFYYFLYFMAFDDEKNNF